MDFAATSTTINAPSPTPPNATDRQARRHIPHPSTTTAMVTMTPGLPMSLTTRATVITPALRWTTTQATTVGSTAARPESVTTPNHSASKPATATITQIKSVWVRPVSPPGCGAPAGRSVDADMGPRLRRTVMSGR